MRVNANLISPLFFFEASFNPPDTIESSTVIDLDEDDIQWQQWLATLTKPGGGY